ncbi:MAG: nuclear transport factor 2 family protein [Proteobacteria bacterium]|nr:nuclear transport factor 2 family protein [Pseudomonadota bacterium]MCP4918107.1 nuclear transport factor 2 family protein [Pseudomonadota bacterium]
MTDRDEVLKQNAAFYDAFRRLDLDAMADVWSQTEADVCIHPGWPILRGWAEVEQSWRGIFEGAGYMRVETNEVQVVVTGDVAHVTCMEGVYCVHEGMTVQGSIAATNLFHRHGDSWKLVLHHGSPIGATAAGVPPDDN